MPGKKLVDFIKEYIDDADLLSGLRDVELDDIKLNIERRELELLCSAAEPPDQLTVKAAESELVRKLMLHAALIDCRTVPAAKPKEQMTSESLARLLVTLRKQLPAVNGFLNNAECFINGDMVSVQLKSGADVVNNLGAPKQFAQLIFERFGEDVGVEFIDSGIPAGDEEVAQYQQELDSGIRSAFAEKTTQEKDLSKLEKTYEEFDFSTQFSKPVYGSIIKTKPISLNEVASDSGSVVVWGTVFSFEARDT